MGSTVFAGLTNVTSEQTEHATPSVAIGRIVCTVCTEYDTIRYGRLTCDQKLTRWPAYSSAQPKNEKIREKLKKYVRCDLMMMMMMMMMMILW